MIDGEEVLWNDFIINNTDVNSVINAWNDTNYKPATNVGREMSEYYISVSGNLICNLTIDNLFTKVQHTYGSGSEAGIRFEPDKTKDGSKLKITSLGENRFGNIRYWNPEGKNNEIIFEGTGSITVADVLKDCIDNGGYYGNHFNSAIGGTDHNKPSNGITINSGIIYAGTTEAENSSAIGGGGNGYGKVTINGGIVTAVASTTGTAIGGGIGFASAGGKGDVTINGGNVYAYNFENRNGIPSAAIGGAGSRDNAGNTGNVIITGGNIYAYAVGGTAIGGGSSQKSNGGNAVVTITGGSIIAISKAGTVSGSNSAGAGIGGGTGGRNNGSNGGNATIRISGDPIIRTGSIGGGKTNSSSGNIGSADILISGGDIQAQFVMAAGAAVKPKFEMSGNALIRNSSTTDNEYPHIEEFGGAIYLEDGTFLMKGGTIRNCSAQKGGAIYIKGTTDTKFEMTGGSILECTSQTDGGALYMEGGQVILSGGTISKNVASQGNGGAISILGGNFSMLETGNAAISENAAFIRNNTGGDGGGIYVTSTSTTQDVIVKILSGSITNNSSDRRGGGLCVDMTSNQSINANVTVGADGSTTNPLITANTALLQGGGLYVKGATANITINGGKILENTTTGYVANPDVANELGMVTLNGGDVTHVTITFDGNGGNLRGNQAVTATSQDIVTATNSLITRPEFERLGYTFLEWNTRPDGKGTTPPDDNIMNTSSKITYFAIWIPGA